MRYGVVIAVILAAGCSKFNPGVCCITPDDCTEIGSDETRPCPAGQACVDLHCTVATCLTEGCPAATPICENESCRGCRIDSECDSGACGEDGACVPESGVIYVTDTVILDADCTRTKPCFGLPLFNDERRHAVMTPGIYVLQQLDYIVSPHASPPSPIHIHGNGAVVQIIEERSISFQVPAFIRDLTINCIECATIATQGDATIERVRFEGLNGLTVNGSLKARDVTFQTGVGIVLNGYLDLDRARIFGGNQAIISLPGSTVAISNLLVWGTQTLALDFRQTTGTVQFSTIADSGVSGSQAAAIVCGAVAVRSSIVSTFESTLPPMANCPYLESVIAFGQAPVAGAMRVDPQFVEPLARDYHLRPGSPARDLVETGPPTDFEGDARPRGERFDIGADETP